MVAMIYQAPSHPLVTDPFLLSILQTTHSLRTAALNLLDVASTPLAQEAPTQLPSPPASPQPAADEPSDDKNGDITLTADSPPPATDSSPPPPANLSHLLAISRAQKPLLTHLAFLRGQNRSLAHAVRNTKAATSASRAEVDTLHLSLQNLYYESRHLAGEIAACEGFKHAYSELPLISEEEFLSREGNQGWGMRRGGGAGREVVMGDDQDENEGEQDTQKEQEVDGNDEAEDWSDEAFMKARIEHEYQERVQLEEERKKLVARKMELVKENAKRKEELGKLDKELEAFIEAAKPIQKTFEKEW